MLTVNFGDHILRDDDILTEGQAKDDLGVSWKGDLNSYNTLLLYSPDTGYVHFLSVNIPGSNILQGDLVISFQPLMKDTNYVIALYQQAWQINIPAVEDLEGLVNSRALSLVDSIDFFVDPPGDLTKRNTTKSNTNQSNTNKKAKEDNYFKPESELTEQQKKYCRCQMKVAAKQTPNCLKDKAWYQKRDGKECYNVYAVCAKSVGTTTHCGVHYNFSGIPDDQLKAYANLHNKTIPSPYNRKEMIRILNEGVKK